MKNKFGTTKCGICGKTVVKKSPNQMFHSGKCKYEYTYEHYYPNRNTLPLTSADAPKRTWGKKFPDTISRSQVVRRNRLKKKYAKNVRRRAW